MTSYDIFWLEENEKLGDIVIEKSMGTAVSNGLWATYYDGNFSVQ